MKNFLIEMVLLFILGTLLFILGNPFGFFMSDMLLMSVTLIALFLFLVLVTFLLGEHIHDEREELHRFVAARFAYLTGAGILMGIVVIQSFLHMLDAWMVLALGGMLLAKLIGSIYAKLYR